MRKIVSKIQKFQSAKPISTKLGIKEEIAKITSDAEALERMALSNLDNIIATQNDISREVGRYFDQIDGIRAQLREEEAELDKLTSEFNSSGLNYKDFPEFNRAVTTTIDTYSETLEMIDDLERSINSMRQ